MKVLLINPLSGWFKYDQMSMPPLGLLILAAKLREDGHEVKYLDRNSSYFRNSRLRLGLVSSTLEGVDKELVTCLSDFKPDLVGITMMTCQIKDSKHIVKLTRNKSEGGVKIIAGGYHPTCEPDSIFNDLPELDAIVRGQGEHAIAEIARGVSLRLVPSVSYPTWDRKPSFLEIFNTKSRLVKVTHNAAPKWMKENNLTIGPARDLLDTQFYQKEGDDVINCYYFKNPASIITSQGCPKRCSFCASVIMEPKLYFNPWQSMIDEIELLVENGATGLFFYDINFPVHKKRTEAFSSAMIASGLSERVKWVACASADNLPYDLLPLMRRAGCVGLVFGFESNSQKILDILNKETDVRKNQLAVDACLANDIRPQSGFIIGVPGETERDINLSLEFIEKNRLLSSLNVILPLPATAINKKLQEDGKLNPRHPDYWGLISDTNAPLTKDRVYSDIPFDRFVDIYEQGMRNVCAPTWETLYIDKPTDFTLEKDRTFSSLVIA